MTGDWVNICSYYFGIVVVIVVKGDARLIDSSVLIVYFKAVVSFIGWL